MKTEFLKKSKWSLLLVQVILSSLILQGAVWAAPKALPKALTLPLPKISGPSDAGMLTNMFELYSVNVTASGTSGLSLPYYNNSWQLALFGSRIESEVSTQKWNVPFMVESCKDSGAFINRQKFSEKTGESSLLDYTFRQCFPGSTENDIHSFRQISTSDNYSFYSDTRDRLFTPGSLTSSGVDMRQFSQTLAFIPCNDRCSGKGVSPAPITPTTNKVFPWKIINDNGLDNLEFKIALNVGEVSGRIASPSDDISSFELYLMNENPATLSRNRLPALTRYGGKTYSVLWKGTTSQVKEVTATTATDTLSRLSFNNQKADINREQIDYIYKKGGHYFSNANHSTPYIGGNIVYFLVPELKIGGVTYKQDGVNNKMSVSQRIAYLLPRCIRAINLSYGAIIYDPRYRSHESMSNQMPGTKPSIIRDTVSLASKLQLNFDFQEPRFPNPKLYQDTQGIEHIDTASSFMDGTPGGGIYTKDYKSFTPKDYKNDEYLVQNAFSYSMKGNSVVYDGGESPNSKFIVFKIRVRKENFSNLIDYANRFISATPTQTALYSKDVAETKQACENDIATYNKTHSASQKITYTIFPKNEDGEYTFFDKVNIVSVNVGGEVSSTEKFGEDLEKFNIVTRYDPENGSQDCVKTHPLAGPPWRPSLDKLPKVPCRAYMGWNVKNISLMACPKEGC